MEASKMNEQQERIARAREIKSWVQPSPGWESDPAVAEHFARTEPHVDVGRLTRVLASLYIGCSEYSSGDTHDICCHAEDASDIAAAYGRRAAGDKAQREPQDDIEASINAVADALNAWDQGEPPRPDTHRHWSRIVGALTGSAQPDSADR